MVKGFKAGALASGLKKTGELDLGLIYSLNEASAAGVFTTNRVQAAPVLLDRERIKSGSCRAVIVNSGNANCCTGEKGMEDARAMARMAAESLGIEESSVLAASTGVIGRPLPVYKIRESVPGLVKSLSEDGWQDFARSIMTTDTVPKTAGRRVDLSSGSCSIEAAAKGAGMIRPDMATMLCFVLTDARIPPRLLEDMLKPACGASFNRITIDGDTSTNDTVLMLAGGGSGAALETSRDRDSFSRALEELLSELAKMIVRDGEGATKLVEVAVKGAVSAPDARKAADAVANSSLVKTALFGEDANWGRIMAAVGRSGASLEPGQVDIYFDSAKIVENGQSAGGSAEADAASVIRKPEFTVLIDLKNGPGAASVWTCDFSVEYVRINADYRS